MKNRLLFAAILVAGLAVASAPLNAQTNSPPAPTPPADEPSFFNVALNYFTSFNTNLDSTFNSEHGSMWAGVATISKSVAPLANEIGVNYDVYRFAGSNSTAGLRISVEDTVRDSGIAGTVLSEGFGVGLTYVIHDTRLTAYLEGVYAMNELQDKYCAEFGLRISKALTTHTFAGVGIGMQLPSERKILSAFAGFTF